MFSLLLLCHGEYRLSLIQREHGTSRRRQRPTSLWSEALVCNEPAIETYRVIQKNGYPVLFWDNFGNSAPILTILSLLQAEIYGA